MHRRNLKTGTHETVSPDVGHVHAFGVPYVRLEPDLVLCEVVSVRERGQRDWRDSLCLFKSCSLRFPFSINCRFLPTIFLVLFFGLAASLGVYERGYQRRIHSRRSKGHSPPTEPSLGDERAAYGCYDLLLAA